MSKDLWLQVYDFSLEVKPDLADYDPDAGGVHCIVLCSVLCRSLLVCLLVLVLVVFVFVCACADADDVMLCYIQALGPSSLICL